MRHALLICDRYMVLSVTQHCQAQISYLHGLLRDISSREKIHILP